MTYIKLQKYDHMTPWVFIISNFVIHPQILICSVFKIASLSPYWLQVEFSMSLLFYLVTFAINLWYQKFITAVFVNSQHSIQWQGQDFDKSTQMHSVYTVTCAEELRSVHLKCNFFAFSFISAEYLQKIWIFNFPR